MGDGISMLYKFDGRQPVIGKDAYVSELANVIGDVVIGNNCYIGHGEKRDALRKAGRP